VLCGWTAEPLEQLRDLQDVDEFYLLDGHS
jgi:hypothetical protein